MSDQLPLFPDDDLTVLKKLDPDEEHFLSYIMAKGGRMIPLDSPKTKAGIEGLKKCGYVRDSLEAGYVELTDQGWKYWDDYMAFLHRTGQMFTCRR